jgi:hypothetical protein
MHPSMRQTIPTSSFPAHPPLMCAAYLTTFLPTCAPLRSDYEGAYPARYLRHGAQPEEEPAILDMPQMSPFWAAGFSFSRGHFKLRVPYDAYQPMVFQGEEIAIGVRAFTWGYDYLYSTCILLPILFPLLCR